MINLIQNIDSSLDLFEEINKLKKEMNAVILAHYYQDPDIQDIADFVGDSLSLSQQAAKTNADVIVFAGVHFMAETAKILSPQKRVFIPDMNAGCSLADSCPGDEFKKFCDNHSDHIVISYVNCSAAVKAVTDIIVTSTNAEQIVKQIPKNTPIIFAPDKNLGAYLSKKLNRKMLLWNGACMVHEIFSKKKIIQLKAINPKAEVLAHPECEESVLNLADFIGSTSGIIKRAQKSLAKSFIVATEVGIIHAMEKAAPGKIFIPAPPTNHCACNECPHMKLNTLEKLYLCMINKSPELFMNEEVRVKALKPLNRMLEMTN